MKTPTTTAILAFALLLHFACGTSLAAEDPKSSQSLEHELALQRGTHAVIWGWPKGPKGNEVELGPDREVVFLIFRFYGPGKEVVKESGL